MINAAPSARRRRVLLISLFHPELVRGGAQQVAFELFQGLQARDDVDPVFLASIDSHYPALYKSGAKITGFDGRPDEYLLLSRDYDSWWHKTSSPAIMEALREFLLENRAGYRARASFPDARHRYPDIDPQHAARVPAGVHVP